MRLRRSSPEKREPAGSPGQYEILANAAYRMVMQAESREDALAKFRELVGWMQEGRGFIFLPLPPDRNMVAHEVYIGKEHADVCVSLVGTEEGK